MRSLVIRLADRLPAGIAAHLRSDSGVTAALRPLANRLLPDGVQVVEVRSGRASGLRLGILPQHEKYYWLGTYEPDVLEVIASQLRPGSTYWDIGSHVGYMVAVASRLVGDAGTVVAFEPNPDNVARLRRTIELNRLANVTVREVALSDRVGTSEFFLSESSSMGSLVAGSPRASSVTVQTSTIDEELKVLPAPHLVKIDVEGAESEVLEGATALLADHQPTLIVEVLSDEQRLDVLSRLTHYRTSMLDRRNLLAVPISREPEPIR